MSRPTSAEDKKWMAESDANTLAEAEVIKKDRRRNAAAKKAAKGMAKEISERANSLSKVAGTKPVTNSNTKLPGIKKR